MSELTTKIQNVGIHACSDQTAITYIDAVNIREMMKQVCIEAILDVYTHNSDEGNYEQRRIVGYRHDLIKAIEDLE